MNKVQMLSLSLAAVRSHWLIRMGRVPGQVGGRVIACVALLLFALAPSIGHASPDTIVGSWFSTVRPTQVPPFVGLGTFTADGGVINTTSLSLASPLESPGHSQGVRTGGRTFAVTFMTFNADASGNVVWTSKVRANVTVSDHGDAFTGVFKVDVFDPSGALIISDTGTVQATRISVEPL